MAYVIKLKRASTYDKANTATLSYGEPVVTDDGYITVGPKESTTQKKVIRFTDKDHQDKTVFTSTTDNRKLVTIDAAGVETVLAAFGESSLLNAVVDASTTSAMKLYYVDTNGEKHLVTTFSKQSGAMEVIAAPNSQGAITLYTVSSDGTLSEFKMGSAASKGVSTTVSTSTDLVTSKAVYDLLTSIGIYNKKVETTLSDSSTKIPTSAAVKKYIDDTINNYKVWTTTTTETNKLQITSDGGLKYNSNGNWAVVPVAYL